MNDLSDKRFISLKWKMLLFVTIGLIAIHLSVVFIHYRNLQADFEKAEATRFEHNKTVLDRLFNQSRQSLQRIASIVPRVVNTVQDVSAQRDLWVSVQFELGLDILQVYDSRGNLDIEGISDWGGANVPRALQGFVRKVLTEEQPEHFLYCTPTCRQFIVTPFLDGRGEANAMMVGRTLVDILLEYPKLTDADIAALAWQDGGIGATQSTLWGRRLSGISNAPQNLPLVEGLVDDFELDDFLDGETVKVDQQVYRFYAIPMDAFGGAANSSFLIFDEITEPLAKIDEQVRTELILGLISLLATYLVLIVVLSRPLGQLRRLADALPLLGEHGYEDIRRIIGQKFLTRSTHDEVDVLGAATIHAADQLEEMQEAIKARSGGLEARMHEITGERKLVHALIESATQPIMVLNNEGMITRMSPAIADLTGSGGAPYMNTPFLSHMPNTGDATIGAEALMKVLSGQVQKSSHECRFRLNEDKSPRMKWNFVYIGGLERSHVLAVGEFLDDRRVSDSKP